MPAFEKDSKKTAAPGHYKIGIDSQGGCGWRAKILPTGRVPFSSTRVLMQFFDCWNTRTIRTNKKRYEASDP